MGAGKRKRDAIRGRLCRLKEAGGSFHADHTKGMALALYSPYVRDGSQIGREYTVSTVNHPKN